MKREYNCLCSNDENSKGLNKKKYSRSNFASEAYTGLIIN